eukprot:g13339.t1
MPVGFGGKGPGCALENFGVPTLPLREEKPPMLPLLSTTFVRGHEHAGLGATSTSLAGAPCDVGRMQAQSEAEADETPTTQKRNFAAWLDGLLLDDPVANPSSATTQAGPVNTPSPTSSDLRHCGAQWPQTHLQPNDFHPHQHAYSTPRRNVDLLGKKQDLSLPTCTHTSRPASTTNGSAEDFENKDLLDWLGMGAEREMVKNQTGARGRPATAAHVVVVSREKHIQTT